jgi:hypothetical protein
MSSTSRGPISVYYYYNYCGLPFPLVVIPIVGACVEKTSVQRACPALQWLRERTSTRPVSHLVSSETRRLQVDTRTGEHDTLFSVSWSKFEVDKTK